MRPRILTLFAALATVLLLNACAESADPPAHYDVILRGGTVYDGSGDPPFVGDVAIDGDRIVAVGDLGDATTDQEINVEGLAVSPGFVNMLSWGVTSLIQDGRGLSDIMQGVTLEVFGEGWSMGPLPQADEATLAGLFGEVAQQFEWQTLGEYLEMLEDNGVSPNVASFVGATTLRIHEVGMDDRPPTETEMENMRALVREAMQEGAMGLGTSLIYPPAFFASTDELIELSKVVGEYDGMYISHMRSEANGLLDAIDEVIAISRGAGIPAEIYHLKVAGQNNWGRMQAVIDKVEQARAEGLQITADMYLYPAGATSLSATMPPSTRDGGHDAFMARLNNPETRAEIIEAMGTPSNDWENMYQLAGPEGILLADVRGDKHLDVRGKTLAEVAAEREEDARETAATLIAETGDNILAVYFLMNEDNIKRQIALPWVSFGSDGDARAPDTGGGVGGDHPRSYGNVPRLLGKYVREEQVIPLEEAIRKLTSLPTANLKISDRGWLREGYFADVVVFDPDTIIDHATFDNPHQLSTGVVHMFINGEQVLSDGEHTGATPGRVVRGPGWNGKRATPGGTVQVEMQTELGNIVIDLYADKAPVTVRNFLRYVDTGKYDGASFYRTVRLDNQKPTDVPIEVVQGGIAGAAMSGGEFDPNVAFEPIAHETTEQTGLAHIDGAISMARFTPGSATGEFFICIGDNNSELDFGGTRNPDGQGFAVFGQVVEGMDVLHQIHARRSDVELPEEMAVIANQIMNEPVAITKVTRK